jgi:uncharacterized ion transporter superfamily protein YfcC
LAFVRRLSTPLLDRPAVEKLFGIRRRRAHPVFYCFLAGGALPVIEKTDAIGNTLDHLVSRFGHRRELILLLVTTLFVVGGAC